jgi:hypothetical protein
VINFLRAGSRGDHVLKTLGANGIFFIGQLQEFDFVHDRASATGELFGDIAAFEPGRDVESARPDDTCHLLD